METISYMRNHADILMNQLPNPEEGEPIPDYNEGREDYPVTPLPNPDEGGQAPDMNGSFPVVPLPNPEEGGQAPDMNGSFPVVPLPNPEEGGQAPDMNGSFPVVPLPNPGEGGQAPDMNGSFPVVPLPNPGEGGQAPGFNGSFPVAPLPNSGEGGQIPGFGTNWPGGNGVWGSIITVFPRPIIPCYFCNTNQNGVVRFLNAAAGYNPFLIYINNQLVVNGLDNGEVSQYSRVSAGLQTITVAGQNGYVYIQKQVNIPVNSTMTIAIINTYTGLDLMEIQDYSCNGGNNGGCFRVCNLSNTNRSINVFLNGGAVIFRNVNYQEVTSFRILPAGYYTVTVSNAMAFTNNPLLTSNLYIRGGVSYTMYIFNWNNSQDAIRILIVEDRRN